MAKLTDKITREIHQTLEKHGSPRFYNSRMISGSKSTYRRYYPDHHVIFNANIVMPEYGKVWHGDLDISLDALELVKAAKELKSDLYILYEMDARFENEDKKAKELMPKARYIIKQDGSIVKQLNEEIRWHQQLAKLKEQQREQEIAQELAKQEKKKSVKKVPLIKATKTKSTK